MEEETKDGETQTEVLEQDFLADVEAADPESFNVCISCD